MIAFCSLKYFIPLKKKISSTPITTNNTIPFVFLVCILSMQELSLLDEIHASFCRFGHLTVDWPHKAESKSYFPPKGQTFFYDLYP